MNVWPLLIPLFWLASQAPPQEPALFHHFHLNTPDPAANMEWYSRNHGAIKVILQGFGVGVRTDKSYLLFERTEEDLAPRTWPGLKWACPERDRCFEDARSRLELYPIGGGPIAKMQILSKDPASANQWFEKHLGVRVGEGKTPIVFVQTSGPLPAGDLIDHIAFSYPNLSPNVVRLQSEGVRVLQKLPHSVMVAGPEGLRIEIAEDNEAGANAYWCPMDPKIRASKPGKCPKCGMQLVPLDPGEYAEYPVQVTTSPRPVQAGRPAKLTFNIQEPHREVTVKNFELTHERLFHLFVVSHDLAFFEHIHPEQQKDGTFTVETVLPKPGPYQTFADFFPSGGTPQVVQNTLVTAGFKGSLLTARAHLTPDAETVKVEGGTKVRLESTGYISGLKQTLTFTLTDARTGEPVRDLEPYLGAWAHMMILSEDMGDYVHGHAELDQSPNGSQMTIETLFPRASAYRIWLQFQRAGKVITVPFTVGVNRLR